MTRGRFRWLTVWLFASGGAGVLALTSITHSAYAFGDDTALIMGPSGLPVPHPLYVDDINGSYIQQLFPGATPLPLTTPEALYPITGVNSLTFDTSVAQGEATLNNAIMQQITDGHHVDVFGYSQSATVASLEMAQLAANHVPSSDVSFILVGDPNNPAGGLFERFVGFSLPSFGWTFSGATPSDLYPTDIYTSEYDGIADFPRYPMNLLSDLNAYLGIAYQHLSYAGLTPDQVSSAVDLGTFGDTTYHIIPADNLPLLEPLRYLPFGNPLADLLQPDMSVLVNLGYGSITQGWDPGSPDVAAPFGLFPTNINPADVFTALAQGMAQGISKAMSDIESGQLTDYSSLHGLLDLSHTSGLTASDQPTLMELIGAAATYANGDVPTTPITLGSSPADIVDILTSLASKDIAALRPIADLGLALGVSLPNYDAGLFLDNLEAGNLVAAIGDPIAADIGILPLPFVLGGGAIVEALATTVYDLLGGIIP